MTYSNTDSGNQLMNYDLKMVLCDWCNGEGFYDDGGECCECAGEGRIENVV